MPEKSVFLGQPQNMLYAVDVCVGGGGGGEGEMSGVVGAHAARGERVDCLTRVGNFLPVCVLYKGEEGLAPLVDAEV